MGRERANAPVDVIGHRHYSLRLSIQNHQSTVEELLDHCKTPYGSIGQNGLRRRYSNLNSIRLSASRSLQQYITRFNNAHNELVSMKAKVLYNLLFQFIEFADDEEYKFQKESFKAKIQDYSTKQLEQGSQIRQAQQELLLRNQSPCSRRPLWLEPNPGPCAPSL